MNSIGKVLLIGGSSGVGKSTLARQLSSSLGARHVEVDDLRVALQELCDPEQLPMLFTFRNDPDYRSLPSDTFVTNLIGLSTLIEPAISAVVEKALCSDEHVIVEGDSILPNFARSYIDSGRPVAAVFLHTTGEVVESNLMRRRSGMGLQRTSRSEAMLSLAYSQTVIRSAESMKLHTLDLSKVQCAQKWVTARLLQDWES